MKLTVISSALVVASLLSACMGSDANYTDDSRKYGHFGAGMHAGRVAGR